MAEKICYYEVLQVERSVSKKDIDRAYRKLAIKYHPDSNRNDDGAIERFKEATEAYEVLSDAEKRQRYDQHGHAGVDGVHQFNDVEDIFDAFGDLFGGGAFGDLFGSRGRGGRRRGRRGSDIRCNVTLSLEEAARGVQKNISFRRRAQCESCDGSGAQPGSQPITCSTCGGHGQVIQSAGILRVQIACPACKGAGQQIQNPCGDCRGTGLQNDKSELTITIPPGVDDGVRLRVQGEGEASPDGGPVGDCYVFINVRQHELFKRDGSHLILQLPISYSQAALGAEIDVPTLSGPEPLVVAAGTQNGDVFTIKGQGVVSPQTGRTGDLLIQVFIEVPKKLNEEQERLLRELAEIDDERVMPQRRSFLDKLRTFFDSDSQPQES